LEQQTGCGARIAAAFFFFSSSCTMITSDVFAGPHASEKSNLWSMISMGK
jgi:hypothetical protein